MPPQKMTSLPHEDWVSSISCQEPRHFFTASYDAHLRIFDYSQNLLQSIPIHEGPITSLTLVPRQTDSVTENHIVATASHDLSARLTQVDLSSEASTRILASLHLHTAPLTSVSSNKTGSHLLTASHDGLIGFWITDVPAKDEVPVEDEQGERRKRRKIADVDGEAERPKRKAPSVVLKSHTGRVSKAVFVGGRSSEAVSAGFDSTIRSWDTENGLCTQTISASFKPFLDIAALPSGNTILAASTDRTVTQYDLRSASASASISSVTHPATPSCIALSSSSEQQFVTGAYDGTVRLWDLRSVRSPVASFKAWEGKKVLSVDWCAGLVGVGGEGGVEVWRMSEGERMVASS